MQSNSEIWLEHDDIDPEASDDLDTTVHLAVASGTITFEAVWAPVQPVSPANTSQHTVALTLEPWTMERYATLDDAARMRVREMLHDTVQRMLDKLPDPDRPRMLTVELTDEMLDAACRVQ